MTQGVWIRSGWSLTQLIRTMSPLRLSDYRSSQNKLVFVTCSDLQNYYQIKEDHQPRSITARFCQSFKHLKQSTLILVTAMPYETIFHVIDHYYFEGCAHHSTQILRKDKKENQEYLVGYYMIEQYFIND